MQRRRNTQSTLNVQFPAAGLSEERAIRETPPFATADCMNVRPENVFNRRRMGGSRPGVAKFFDQDLGAEIRCIKPLTYIKESDTRTFYNDPFDTLIYPSSGDWATATWLNRSLITDEGCAVSSSSTTLESGDVLKDIAIGTDYTVETLLQPYRDPHGSAGVYSIYLRMNNTTPVLTTDGVRVVLALRGDTGAGTNYIIQVYRYVGGVFAVLVNANGTIGTATTGQSWRWFKCNVNGTALTVKLGDTTIATATLPTLDGSGNPVGRRVGLGLQKNQAYPGTTPYPASARVATFRIRYAGTPDRERTVAFAVCSGHVWRETEIGVMEQSASTVTLDTGRIQATEYLQKMYIADCKQKVSKRSQVFATTAEEFFTTTNYNIGDYSVTSNVATLTFTGLSPTTTGLLVGQYLSVLEIGDAGAPVPGPIPALMGIFQILSVTATTVTISVNTPDVTSVGAVSGTAVVRGVVLVDAVVGAAATVAEDMLEFELVNAAGIVLGGGVTPIDAVNGSTVYMRYPILSVPDGTTTINYWLWRGAKVYDPVADTLKLWQTDSLVAESFNIVGVKSESGTITYTTSPAHKFQEGQRVLIDVMPVTGPTLTVPVSTTPGNISNKEISGVFTITKTDPISAAPTTFEVEKSIGSDNVATALDDIGTRKSVQGFKKRITVVGGGVNAEARIKTTRKHGFTVGDWVTLAGQSSSNLDGTWEITAITDFTIDVAAPTGTFGGLADTGLKLWPGEVYTAKGTAKLSDYQGKGYVPAGCSLISNWRGRMILCRGNTAYYSRIDDPNDFDYGETDEASAVATTLSDSGIIGQPITAVCPVDEDTVIFGCKNELWRQTGDPAAGGKLYNVSRKAGVVDANAWTITPDGLFVFLSEDGIYSYSVKSPASVPVPVTAKPLPMKLRNLATATVNVSMAFDTLAKGVHLFNSFDSGFTTHWFLDWQDKGMWPVRFGDTSCDPMCCTAFNGRDPSEGGVLLGCRDGYVRMHRDGQGTDDGVPFDSYLCFGPIRPAGNQMDAGTIMEMTVNPVRDYALANTVKVELFPGYNHQEALEREKTGTAIFSDTFDAVQPLTDSCRPQVSEGSFAIKASSNVQVFPWGFEAMSLLVQNDGPNYRRG